MQQGQDFFKSNSLKAGNVILPSEVGNLQKHFSETTLHGLRTQAEAGHPRPKQK